MVCFVFVHGLLKLLPMVFYGVGLSHGIGISLNILLIVPTVVVVPLMAVMNFQMGEDKVYQSGDDRRMTTFGPSVASIASVMFPIVLLSVL